MRNDEWRRGRLLTQHSASRGGEPLTYDAQARTRLSPLPPPPRLRQPAGRCNAKLEQGAAHPRPEGRGPAAGAAAGGDRLKLQTAGQQELERAFASSELAQRAHALEGLRQSLGPAAAPQILKGLSDQNEMVRSVATVAAGELTSAGPADPPTVVNDPDPIVQVSVRFALHPLGYVAQPRPGRRSALDPSDRVRGQTAFVLGRLGEPSAIKYAPADAVRRPPGRPRAGRRGAVVVGRQGRLDRPAGLTVSGRPDEQMMGVSRPCSPATRR